MAFTPSRNNNDKGQCSKTAEFWMKTKQSKEFKEAYFCIN
jgi:hypothetical protein